MLPLLLLQCYSMLLLQFEALPELAGGVTWRVPHGRLLHGPLST
jgi:hypothetical protein